MMKMVLLAVLFAVMSVAFAWESVGEFDIKVMAPASNSSGDSYFYTTMYIESTKTQVSWVTCGADAEAGTSGCYGSGKLGPFQTACAVASTNKGIVAVMDANGGAGNTTAVYVYQQVESSKPSIKLLSSVTIPEMKGGNEAQCSLGVLGKYVYAGTDQSYYSSRIYTKDFSVQTQSMSSPPDVTRKISVSRDTVIVAQKMGFIGYDASGAMVVTGGSREVTFVAGATAYTP